MHLKCAMKSFPIMVGLLLATAACAARSVPAARVGSAEAAVRAAREHGATRLPDAALHLRLAEDQVTRARRLIDEGEHERAEWLLVRAEADASVADALAREAMQKSAAEETNARARALATQRGEETVR
jgi:hypothetical protein